MAPSEATAPSAKLFADALREFIHPAEWMRNRQRELAKAQKSHESLTKFGQPDPESRVRVAELTADGEQAWKETEAARHKVKAMAISPAHPVDGVNPEDWLFRVLRDVDVTAELVGGLHAALARQDLTETQDVQFRALITVLRQRELEARNISCVAPQSRVAAAANGSAGAQAVTGSGNVEPPPKAPDGFYSPTDIAKALPVPAKADAIRKALYRLFKENRLPDSAWMENSNPAKGQAKILYKLSAVRPLLARFQPEP